MSTLTTHRTIHTGCAVRAVDTDPRTGWCLDHETRVYRDGHDWHRDPEQDGLPFVLDARARSARYTGRVTLAGIDGHTDRELADVAGYGPEHHGFDVTRYDDGTALVSLWND